MAASQIDSSSLFFLVNDSMVIQGSSLIAYNEKEYSLRKGIGSLYSRLQSDKAVITAFIGESITQSKVENTIKLLFT